MKACVLATCVLAATVLVAEGGLLKVPRVYNALITSNEPLLPSRAVEVSSPVVLYSSPYVALEPSFPLAEAPGNYSEVEAPSTSSPEVPDEPPSTSQPPVKNAQEGGAPTQGPLPTLPLAYGSGVPFPFTFYNNLGYSPFSYYPSFLAYSYPLVSPGVGLPYVLPQASSSPAVLPQPQSTSAQSEPVKNNKPENSVVPDVSPPPPPRGAAVADDTGVEAA